MTTAARPSRQQRRATERRRPPAVTVPEPTHAEAVAEEIAAEARRKVTPQPGPQSALCECPVKLAFIGGARFGGKSYGLIIDCHEHASRWGKHARGIFFRRTYKELEEVIRIGQEILTPFGVRWNEAKHVFTWPSGATLKMRHLMTVADAMLYQGHSYTWLAFDEAGNWPDPAPLDLLWGTLRSTEIPMDACVRRDSGNPGGPGQVWIHARYIEGRTPFVPFDLVIPVPGREEPLRIRTVFIPARLEDNAAAMAQDGGRAYEAQLAAAGSDALYRAWRYGDWDAFVGQAFGEWDRTVHVLPNRRPPKHLPQVAGLDWGWAKGVMHVAVRDEESRYEAVHEVVFQEIYARKCATGIAERWTRAGLKPSVIYYDDQMDQDTGIKGGMKLIDEFRLGLLDHYKTLEECPAMVKAAKGPGSRKVKYDLMHRLLAFTRAPDGTVHPWQRPLFAVQERCKDLIRTLPALPNDPDKPGDVDTDADDHAYDAICNILLSEHPAAQKTSPREPQDVHPGLTKKGRKARWQDDDDDALDDVMAGASAPGGYDPGYRMVNPYQREP